MFKKYRYFRYLNVALIIVIAVFLFSHNRPAPEQPAEKKPVNTRHKTNQGKTNAK